MQQSPKSEFYLGNVSKGVKQMPFTHHSKVLIRLSSFPWWLAALIGISSSADNYTKIIGLYFSALKEEVALS